MKKVRGTVFGIVGGALGLLLGALLISASRDKDTTLSGRPGLTLGLWFIAGGGVAVIAAVAGRRQAAIKGPGLLAGVVIGGVGIMSSSSWAIHKDRALLLWLIAAIPMIVGAILALRSGARPETSTPASALPTEGGAEPPQAVTEPGQPVPAETTEEPTETAAAPAAGVCSQCGAPLPSAELDFCPNCGAERESEQS